MKWNLICIILAPFLTFFAPAHIDSGRVQISITNASRSKSVIHWKISNHSDRAVYVYDVYLWGPAYAIHEQPMQRRMLFDTSPVQESPSCPPNRFPPVLLLMVGKGRSIEGDLADDRIRQEKTPRVSLRITVGTDPYTVVSEAERFLHSDCVHNPYDAIVRWGDVLESNTIEVGP